VGHACPAGRARPWQDPASHCAGILAAVWRPIAPARAAQLTGWEIYPLPIADPARWPFSTKPASAPALHRGVFNLTATGDTFLDMRGWGKGSVWINGQNLGRYWRIGPQQSLFVPAPWLKLGANEIIILDLEERGPRSIDSAIDPIYETPAGRGKANLMYYYPRICSQAATIFSRPSPKDARE